MPMKKGEVIFSLEMYKIALIFIFIFLIWRSNWRSVWSKAEINYIKSFLKIVATHKTFAIVWFNRQWK